MSAFTLNATPSAKSIVNQRFLAVLANPSDLQSMRLSRRGRLARTLVVLSLAVVLVAGFAATSGANQVADSATARYTVVVVAPGESLWSVAAAYATGDVAGMVNEIREVNNLNGFDLQAGQKLRVPIQSR